MGSKYTKENTNKLIETTVFSNKIGRMPLPSKACSPLMSLFSIIEISLQWQPAPLGKASQNQQG